MLYNPVKTMSHNQFTGSQSTLADYRVEVRSPNVSNFWETTGVRQPIALLCSPPSTTVKPMNAYQYNQELSKYERPNQNIIPNPRCPNQCCPCKEDVINTIKKRLVRKVTSPHSKYGIYCIRFIGNGSNLAVGYGNGAICIVNNNQQNPSVSKILHDQKKHLATIAIKVNNDRNLMLTAGAAGEVNAWDVQNISRGYGPKVSLNEEGNEIYALDVSADGLIFATAGKDRHIRLYDTNNITLYHTLCAPDGIVMDNMNIFRGHCNKVFALRFHPEESHIFVTAGWDNCMKIWDKRMSKSARQSVAGPRVCGDALDVRGNYILTGSYVARDSIQFWDLRNGRFIRNVKFPHDKRKGDFIYCANFVSDSKIVAGGSGLNAVFGIDLTSDELVDIVEYDRAVLALDAWNGDNVIASGGVGGVLQLAYITK